MRSFAIALARTIVIVGAVAAGWFGYQRLELDTDVGNVAVSPWASETTSDDDWTSFVFVSSDETVRRTVAHDGSRQATDIEFQFTDQNRPPYSAEVTRGAVWERTGGSEWSRSPDSTTNDHVVESLYAATPTRLVDAFPPASYGFITVVEHLKIDDVERYTVSFDAERFAAAAPITSQRWIDGRLLNGSDEVGSPAAVGGSLLFEFDVRSDGHIVRWSDVSAGTELTWVDLEEPIVFESPATSEVDATTSELSSPISGQDSSAPHLFEIRVTQDGKEQYIRRIDTELGVIQDDVLEFTSTDLFEFSAGEWHHSSVTSPTIDADDLVTLYNGIGPQIVPLDFETLVPPSVPYVSIVDSEQVDVGRRMTIAIDHETWKQQAPESYGEWYQSYSHLGGDHTSIVIVVDEASGLVTELGDGLGLHFAWTTLTEPLQLQSALQIDN